MAFTDFVAWRYLKSNRENRFFSWISTLTILGIGIGVSAMILVLSVINGFEKGLRERFLAANAHVLAYRFPEGIKDYKKLEDSFMKDFSQDLTGVAPFVHGDTMGKKDYIIHAILIKGISPDKRQNVQDVTEIIRPRESLDILQKEVDAAERGEKLVDVPSIILGSGLLSIMQAKIGDRIQLISPKVGSDDPFGEMKSYRVVGVYDSGLQHYDTKLGILSFPAARELFHMGDVVTGIEMGLKDPTQSAEVAKRMREKFDLSIKEWQSYNSNIFEAMRNERTVIGFIVALVAFVASFNILTTLFVSVTQKQRDISILKALGANNGQILRLFIKQSLLMSLVGGFLGVVLAYFLSVLLKTYHFIDLPDIYLLATLPILIDWKVYATITFSALVIAGIAGIYPAWIATRVVPTQGLTMGRRE